MKASITLLFISLCAYVTAQSNPVNNYLKINLNSFRQYKTDSTIVIDKSDTTFVNDRFVIRDSCNEVVQKGIYRDSINVSNLSRGKYYFEIRFYNIEFNKK